MKKKTIGGILGIIVIIIFANITTDPNIWHPKALTAIGILFGAVIWIITDFLPDYVAALVMSTLFVLLGVVEIDVAFSFFSSKTMWIMLGALLLGAAAGKTGFLKRLALLMMKALPPTYNGQCIAFLLSGLIITPMVPSTAAKSTIIAPVVQSTAESLGVKPRSKAAKGLFLSFFTGYILTAHFFLSGSYIAYSLLGLFEDKYPVTWMQYFLWGLPCLAIVMILMAFIILKFYKPDEEIKVSNEYVESELKKLGAWSWQEKVTAITLVGCLVFWILEKTVGIPAVIVALIGGIIVLATGILDKDDFKSRIPWNSVIMIGCFVSVGSVVTELKLDETSIALLGDRMVPLMNNPYLLIIALSILIVLLRLIFPSMTVASTLPILMLLPFASEFNIHPWVIAFICYTASNIWFLVYQNSPMIMSLAATDSQLVEHNDMVLGSFQYLVVLIVGLLISVPYWHVIGLL